MRTLAASVPFSEWATIQPEVQVAFPGASFQGVRPFG